MPCEQRQVSAVHVTRPRLAAGLVCGIASLIVILWVPYLPLGTDLYVHVLWPWQVMRCLSVGSLPLWFPDLNAGFGSPGVQLYSPLVPTLSGALGLLFGTAGRGLRAVLVVTAVAMFAAVPDRSHRTRVTTVLMLLAAPAVVVEFFGRFPVAQLAGMPLAFVLLHRAAAGGWSWRSDGVLLALMWLAHSPTAIMVGLLGALAPWLGPADREPGTQGHSSGFSGSVLAVTLRFVTTSLVAAGLTAWHWWPLLATAEKLSFRSALTGGEQDPLRNLIGVSHPHLADINAAMGWAAAGLLAALLVVGGWRTRSGRMAVLAVFLSTNLSMIIWQHATFLSWVNFPWRWLLPATLLAVPVVARAGVPPHGGRQGLAVALLMLPLLAAPLPVLAPDPGLAADTSAQEAGRRVAESFGGNPLLVDVKEHRPLWWDSLAPTLGAMGDRAAMLVPDGGAVEIVEWRPLRRVISVTAPGPATTVARLLADDHWWASVNDVAVAPQRWGAALAVEVPEGRSTLLLTWSAGWRAVVGAVIALATLGGVALACLRRRRTAQAAGEPLS